MERRRDPRRYVLHPGWIISRSDGDRHFINGQTLAHLYGVDYRTCVFGDVPPPRYIERPDDVHLYPRHDGNYTLPGRQNNESCPD